MEQRNHQDIELNLLKQIKMYVQIHYLKQYKFKGSVET